MSREKNFDKAGSPTEEPSTMRWVAGNGLTLEELEQLEEAAHHSQTLEAKSVLRLAAALREALQLRRARSVYKGAGLSPADRKRITRCEQQIARYEDAKIKIDLEPGRATRFHPGPNAIQGWPKSIRARLWIL